MKLSGLAGAPAGLGSGVLALAFLVRVLAPDANAAEAAPAAQAMLQATFKIKNREQAGTCFLVAPPKSAGWPADRVVLVTAGHTFEKTPDPDFAVVMRVAGGQDAFTRKEVPLKVRLEGKPLWTTLPGVDIAALPFDVPKDVNCRPLSFDQLADREAFTHGKLQVTTEAWVFCFPAQLEANAAGFPIVRHATIASVPLGGATNDTYLADLATFGGDSGAPMMIVDRSDSSERPLVVGLITGMERQTDKTTMPFEELTVHTPMGLAIVLRPEEIRLAIERLVAKP